MENDLQQPYRSPHASPQRRCTRFQVVLGIASALFLSASFGSLLAWASPDTGVSKAQMRNCTSGGCCTEMTPMGIPASCLDFECENQEL